MEGHLRKILNSGLLALVVTSLLFHSSGCATNDKATPDDTSALESELESDGSGGSAESTESADNLENELEEGSQDKQAEATPQTDADNIEEELTLDEAPAAPAENTAQAPAETPAAPAEELTLPPPAVDTAEPTPVEPVAPVAEQPPPPAEAPAAETAGVDTGGSDAQQVDALTNITNIRFKADNGGSIVIEGDGPLQFSNRMNEQTNQFVVEITNSRLPKKLERPLITKDFKASVGSINAYQSRGSTTTRVVVQLKAGATEPGVSQEDNRLVVSLTGGPAPVASAEPESAPAPEEASTEVSVDNSLSSDSKILSSRSLEEFLNSNNKFYGKKISLEVSDVDVREVIRLISEESGANLIISDEVKGNLTIKLRDVPWDQALVVVLRSKKLGYTRNGNVLRIAPIAEIRQEETDTLTLLASRKTSAPLVVRKVSISYAKIADIETQSKNFLSERGKIVGDARTNTVFISDVKENIDRVASFIQSIDIPPPQVMIEGKVVEAAETFLRSFGINWGAPGRSTRVGSQSGRSLRLKPGFTVATGNSGGAFNLNFAFGTLDVLGDINASLSLQENQENIKVLSSPRIVTLHNEAAAISQTVQVPLQTTTVSNGTPVVSTTFKDVSLKLNVTPQITNDGSVILDMDINREFLGAPSVDGAVAPINSRTAKSKMLVRNGQTAVVGGIYVNDSSNGETKVPVLGDIPVFGYLFKGKRNQSSKNELLIFVTPRILSQNTAGTDSFSPPEGAPSSDEPALEEELEGEL